MRELVGWRKVEPAGDRDSGQHDQAETDHRHAHIDANTKSQQACSAANISHRERGQESGLHAEKQGEQDKPAQQNAGVVRDYEESEHVDGWGS